MNVLNGPAVMDGAWRLIKYEPRSGKTTWAMIDGDEMVVRESMPVAQTIEANLLQRNHVGKFSKGDLDHFGSVPMNILFSSGLNEAVIQDDQKFISRWFNDSDNRAWRTTEGKV